MCQRNGGARNNLFLGIHHVSGQRGGAGLGVGGTGHHEHGSEGNGDSGPESPGGRPGKKMLSRLCQDILQRKLFNAIRP